jgi:hypothetical protein
MPTALTQEQYIDRVKSVHGAKYSYENTQYTSVSKKIRVTCPLHGVFQIAASGHIQGRGCKACGSIKRAISHRLTQEEFLARVKDVHGDKYGLEEAVYSGSSQRVAIVCPKHGKFYALASNFMRGSTCTKCGKEASGFTQRLNTKSFIALAKSRHGDIYDYSKTVYKTAQIKVEVGCTIHGSFWLLPYCHTMASVSQGCRHCSWDKLASERVLSLQEFLDRANIVHGEGTYGYSQVNYVSSGTHVNIECPDHGLFSQTPENHIYVGSGCPRCQHRHSSPQQEIEAFLKSVGADYMSNTRAIISPKEIDSYIPSHKLALEFNGMYWHSLNGTEPPHFKDKHKTKFNICQSKGIQLLQIDEYEWMDPIRQAIWKSVISSKLGLHEKIHARATVFKEITRKQANTFLALNHLQGDTPAVKWAYGLFLGDELVGALTFANHQKTQISLSRLAFRTGLTIVGGSQKLFKNALKHLPKKDIVTFSNNRYSDGSIYGVLGFIKDKDLPPSYQWFYQGQVRDKRQFRHSALPSILGSAYESTLTEHENLYRAGARCLYDAGYQRWVFATT